MKDKRFRQIRQKMLSIKLKILAKLMADKAEDALTMPKTKNRKKHTIYAGKNLQRIFRRC